MILLFMSGTIEHDYFDYLNETHYRDVITFFLGDKINVFKEYLLVEVATNMLSFNRKCPN